ncbi:MAG: hypothetical protein LBM69_01315, partial [Lachnospiraceae bacterium]|nr:hypothetical protein [Lachnospiraceae bacterium]
GVLGVIRSVEMRPRENERLLVRAFSLPGLIGTPRESNTQNCPLLCSVRPGYTALKRKSANTRIVTDP